MDQVKFSTEEFNVLGEPTAPRLPGENMFSPLDVREKLLQILDILLVRHKTRRALEYDNVCCKGIGNLPRGFPGSIDLFRGLEGAVTPFLGFRDIRFQLLIGGAFRLMGDELLCLYGIFEVLGRFPSPLLRQ